MKNLILSTLGAVILSFGLTGVAQGTLVGDTVTIQHFFSSSGYIYNATEVDVVAGTGDAVYYPYYSVNMEGNQVQLNFSKGIYFGDMAFNGLEVSGLDDDTGGLLTDVTLESNINGWNSSIVTFGDNYLGLNLAGLSVGSGSFLTATLGFTPDEIIPIVQGGDQPPIDIGGGGDGQTPVPEPATMLLFGIGLTAFAGYGRKKIIK